jgi:hypothetical protein
MNPGGIHKMRRNLVGKHRELQQFSVALKRRKAKADKALSNPYGSITTPIRSSSTKKG